MTGGLAIAAVLACLVAGALVGAVVAWTLAARRSRRELAASRAQLAGLQERVDELARALSELQPDREAPPVGYVITDAGSPAEPVSTAAALSVTLGDPMIRLAALAYGVRRALSAESRNRIAFEVRREVKRARKQRRRDVRHVQRDLRRRPGASSDVEAA